MATLNVATGYKQLVRAVSACNGAWVRSGRLEPYEDGCGRTGGGRHEGARGSFISPVARVSGRSAGADKATADRRGITGMQ